MTARAQVDVDVAVIGSGFSGSLAALALRQRGQRVALLERARHPRFAIGESTTPLTNLLLEEFADRYDLPQIRAFSKWGTWQRARPDVACGLKRGFTFLFHQFDEPFGDDPRHAQQLMVGASPHDDVADTHWYRPDFDHALVREAESAGALYFDETRVERIRDAGAHIELSAVRAGATIPITARFVIDAGGPRGWLTSTLGRGSAPHQWLPPTQGLYTHFRDVGLWENTARIEGTPPYPPDAAALHHVFPGGWIWVLRFNNGITSAGAALTDELAGSIGAADGEAAWHRLLDRLPSVRRHFAGARPTMPFIHVPRLAFRCHQVVGANWALLPSAAGVIDPLLSTGFPLTLLGLGRLLTILEETTPGSARAAALAEYERTTQQELDVTEQLVAALYACMTDPPLFKRLASMYFAAASFSEAVRRLERPHVAPGFLLNAHPSFGAELRECANLVQRAPPCDDHARRELFERIDRAVQPFDTIGLLDRTRADWYPVLASDLIGSAPKLQASPGEIDQLLARCGFARIAG